MKKYRIVKVVTPQLTKNHDMDADFVPRILWVQHFEVQEKKYFFSCWKLIWECNSLESARVLKEQSSLKKSKYVIK